MPWPRPGWGLKLPSPVVTEACGGRRDRGSFSRAVATSGMFGRGEKQEPVELQELLRPKAYPAERPLSLLHEYSASSHRLRHASLCSVICSTVCITRGRMINSFQTSIFSCDVVCSTVFYKHLSLTISAVPLV